MCVMCVYFVRCVIFRSELMHEVLPNQNTSRLRCALTMWACADPKDGRSTRYGRTGGDASS